MTQGSPPPPVPLKRSSFPPMLRQLTSCVNEESCAVKCAFDFDYDDDEFYVIDEDGDEDDEDGINNDGAYWKLPGGHPVPTYRVEEGDIELDNYDHETLTTRFSRQTSATLESILGVTTSSILSPSANFIIEDLHLLEQKHNQNTTNANDRKRATLAKLGTQRSLAGSPLLVQTLKHHPGVAASETLMNANRIEPLPLHQNLESNSPPTTTTSPNTAAPNDNTTPKRSGATLTIKRISTWSLSQKCFCSTASPKPSPRVQSLPPIIEKTADDSDVKSKNTHPSSSTATVMESLTSSEIRYDELVDGVMTNTGVELTLSESIVEMEDDDDDDDKSEIIRLDSIIPLVDSSPYSCSSSCFFSDDHVVLERTSKRKRMWKKFCSKVAAWKRITMFHLFPHRQRYTRFEI
ncbi:MAG: hypothetical protein SGBAC_010278 [Bacillariaceae sp.]